VNAPTHVETARPAAEQAARASYGKLIAILASWENDITNAEEALSEALFSSPTVWPERGVPSNPEAWLVAAARNRLKNATRDENVRWLAEQEILHRLKMPEEDQPFPEDRLRLMFVCAHPAIDPAMRTPLILKTVLGIDATRIAAAFLVKPATMLQWLVRAKTRIRDAGIRFSVPNPAFGQGWHS